MELTHKQAVRRMGMWLRNTRSCGVVVTELSTACHETPDAIGFYGNTAQSILVEVKVSRADFLADRDKDFRVFQSMGMGDLRYYACPEGVVRPEDDLGNWGLLEIHERKIKMMRESKEHQANKRSELKLAVSVMRRLEIATAVYVRHEAEPAEPV